MLALLNRSVSKPAGVPDERVVARAERDHVVSGAAYHGVIAHAADDGVVAGAAIDGELDLPGVEHGGVYRVVSGTPVDEERVVAGLRPSIVTRAAKPLTTTDE